MTIAACYLTSEGVVLGADSTLTLLPGPGREALHYFDFAQKIFELGPPGSTIATMFWGLGAVGKKSYRSFTAELADKAKAAGHKSPRDMITLAKELYQQEYLELLSDPSVSDLTDRVRELHAKGEERDATENEEYDILQNRLCGFFCLAGRASSNQEVQAFELGFAPCEADPGDVKEIPVGQAGFWGCPNLFTRLTVGADRTFINSILQSGKWAGTADELLALLRKVALQRGNAPLRDAIDYVYVVIYTTIKAMKFSQLPQVCGGPIEVAVISTDRPFRWVRHKDLDDAITTHHM